MYVQSNEQVSQQGVGRVGLPKNGIDDRLASSREHGFLIALSGLKRLKINMVLKGHPSNQYHPSESCWCVACQEANLMPGMVTQLEDAIKVEVFQPRAPYGKSPRYLERQARYERAWKRSAFVKKKELFEERMQLVLANQGKMAMCQELRARFAAMSEKASA